MRIRLTGRVLLAIAWLAGISLTLSAQDQATVSGRVYDAITMHPLPGATVIFGRNRGTVTDGEGKYRFRVAPGMVNITFQYVGYRVEVRRLEPGPGDSVELNIPMHQQATEIDQVVISAGKAEQKLSDLTVSVSVIRPEKISAGHISDAQELMNKSPGIEVLDGQASIRGGSGYSYGAGSRVMILIDGLPMLSADAGHISWGSLPFENLSKVEIIKGASSVLYGSSALNGIINFRTADATEEGVTRCFAETGIFGKTRRIEWVWWDTPRIFSSASVSHMKKYGNTDVSAGAFLLIDNGYRKRNENNFGRVNLKLKHRSSKVRGLTYGLAMNALHSRKTDFVSWENADTGALIQDTSTARRMQGTSLAIDPSVSFRRGNRFTHDIKSRIRYTENYYPNAMRNNSDALSQYVEYQFTCKASDKIHLNAGLTQFSSQIRSPFYGDHKAWNTAGYTQADMAPVKKLKLVAGVRMEQYTLDDERDKLVPLFRAGVNYHAFRQTFFRASWGQGYRYPSIAEKHASTTLGAVRVFPNLFLKPESGWNSEIAVKHGILNSFLDGYVDLALFYTQNKDMIEYVFGIYPDPVTQQFGLGFRATNIEYSRVYGFELELLMNVKMGAMRYVVNGGYVYMYPVEFNPITNKNTDTYLKFRRKHAFNVNLSTEYGKFDFSLQAYARSKILNIDDVFLNPLTREDILPGFYDYWTNHNQGYFTMDAGIGYALGKHYKVSLTLKNLTNTEYMGRPGDIQPQRNMSLRIAGTF